MIRAVHLRPPSPVSCGDYDLDAVAIEIDDDGSGLDFRLELGLGLGIYWALPAARGGRLRLAHVDGAAYTLDEPELVADPFIADLPLQTWQGDLATFGDGSTLTLVAVEATASPGWYRCIVRRRTAGGKDAETVFEWRG